MAVLADTERRFGVGLGGAVLYLALFVGGVFAVWALGDLPFADVDNRLRWDASLATFLYAIGLLGVILAVGNLRTYLHVARCREVQTGAAATTDGSIELHGEVHDAGAGLPTPLGRSQAVAYTTRVLENTHDDAETAADSEKNWQVVHVGEDAVPFEVDDGSGPVRVDPDGAKLHVRDSASEMVEAGEPLPDDVSEYLDSTSEAVDEDAHLRVEERALEPGEETTVVGRADAGSVAASLVGEGDHEARLRTRVVWGGGVGLAIAGTGLLGLLWIGGLV